jgi:hypothetical protein
MKQTGLILTALATTALVNVACSSYTGSLDSGPDVAFGMDSGTPDSGPGADASTPDAGAISVTQALQMYTALKGKQITVSNAVVVATAGGAPGSSGTFWIEDAAAAGAGFSVYHGKSDTGTFPAIGDIVTVSGRFNVFDGQTQIAASAKYGIALNVQVTNQNHSGMAASGAGAYAPAGAPIALSSPTGYEHSNDPNTTHPEQVGNVLKFSGPLTATTASGFIATVPVDAGSPGVDGGFKTHPEGFMFGNVWVDDSLVYKSCILPLDGGVPDLTHGVTGVWDRYQDYYSGSSANPAPVVPVLILTKGDCTDLNPP